MWEHAVSYEFWCQARKIDFTSAHIKFRRVWYLRFFSTETNSTEFLSLNDTNLSKKLWKVWKSLENLAKLMFGKSLEFLGLTLLVTKKYKKATPPETHVYNML